MNEQRIPQSDKWTSPQGGILILVSPRRKATNFSKATWPSAHELGFKIRHGSFPQPKATLWAKTLYAPFLGLLFAAARFTIIFLFTTQCFCVAEVSAEKNIFHLKTQSKTYLLYTMF